jgi:hypothetical protein
MSCDFKVKVCRGLLEILSVVKSTVGLCSVDDQRSASHDIEFKNYGIAHIFVTIDGDCQTSCVRYLGNDGSQEAWKDQVVVPFIPGHGRCGTAATSRSLTSLCSSRDQRIKMGFEWYEAGVPTSFGKKSIDTQVETL